MRTLVRLVLVLFAAATSLAAQAQTEVPPSHFGQHSVMEKALQQVDLSATQKQAVRQIMESHEDEVHNLAQSQHELHESLSRTDPRSSDYAAQVGDLAQQAAALAAQRVQLLARIKREIYGALTEAQKGQLTAALAVAEAQLARPPTD